MMLQWRVHCLLDVNHVVNSIISKRSLELIKADGIHSVEHGWNQRSPILSRELNYITIRKIIIFSLPWALWSRVAARPHIGIYQSSNAYNQSPYVLRYPTNYVFSPFKNPTYNSSNDTR